MKIGFNNINKVVNIYKNNSRIQNKSINNDAKSDRIELSVAAKDLNKYLELAKNIEVENGRSEEIKELIRNGKYNVDSKELAKSLMELMKESDK